MKMKTFFLIVLLMAVYSIAESREYRPQSSSPLLNRPNDPVLIDYPRPWTNNPVRIKPYPSNNLARVKRGAGSFMPGPGSIPDLVSSGIGVIGEFGKQQNRPGVEGGHVSAQPREYRSNNGANYRQRG